MGVLDKFFPDPSIVERRHRSRPTFSDRVGLGQLADILDNDPAFQDNSIKGDSGCNRPIVINLTINMPDGGSAKSQVVIPASIEGEE